MMITAMRREPRERIDSRALQVWRWYGILWSLALIAVALACAWILAKLNLPPYIFLLPIALALAMSVFLIFLLPGIRWRRWRYEVSEKEIDLQHGVLFIKRTLIPMSRVQHVDTEQGPLLKRYGLATVTFSTAAGSHNIPALSLEKADALRDQIAYLAGVAEDV